MQGLLVTVTLVGSQGDQASSCLCHRAVMSSRFTQKRVVVAGTLTSQGLVEHYLRSGLCQGLEKSSPLEVGSLVPI